MTLPYSTPRDEDDDYLTVEVWDDDPTGLFLEMHGGGGAYVSAADRVPLARAILPDGWVAVRVEDSPVSSDGAPADAPTPVPDWQRQLTGLLAVAVTGALDAVAEHLRSKR